MRNIFSKKGMAFAWIYALIFLFALGLIYVVFNEVLSEQVLPLSNDLIPNDFENKSEIVAQNNLWMNYWLLTPIICFVVVCIYLIVEAVGSSTG